MKGKPRANTIALFVLVVVMVIGLAAAFGKAGELSAALSNQAIGEDGELVTMARGHVLGLLPLLVPLTAVALAFITREVVSSLFVSLIYGYLLLGAVNSGGAGVNPFSFLLGAFTGTANSVIETAADYDSISVVILCLILGGLVTVISASGAFRSLAMKIVKRVKNPRHAYLMAEALGLCIFFDDYANALISGPVMRPVTDRVGVSREKLAFIVDSTAAPIASIALVSSWVATQVAAIKNGLDVAGVSESAYSIFVSGIPYSFYNVLALAFILIITLTRREYGPMLQAEMRARKGETLRKGSIWKESEAAGLGKGAKAWVAIVPILTLCIISFVGFYIDGRAAAVADGQLAADAAFNLANVMVAFGNANTVFIIMAAGLFASIMVLVFGAASKSFSFIDGMQAWLTGASDLLITVMILVLAWSLSSVITELGTVYYLVDFITGNMPYWLVPSVVFMTCCMISFGIGSYGCMAIVVPMVIPLAYAITAQNGAIEDTWQYIVACSASVLSGSVFGDHCSPITDVTILSSMGAGCDNIDHVKTQMPYALTIAGASVLCGTLLAGLGVKWWVSYPLAIALLVLVLMTIGKNPDKLLEQNASKKDASAKHETQNTAYMRSNKVRIQEDA